MNSSFSMLSASILEMLSDILDTLDQLHTASITFTVLREMQQPYGLNIEIQCLLAEQKAPVLVPLTKNHVEKMNKDLFKDIKKL